MKRTLLVVAAVVGFATAASAATLNVTSNKADVQRGRNDLADDQWRRCREPPRTVHLSADVDLTNPVPLRASARRRRS